MQVSLDPKPENFGRTQVHRMLRQLIVCLIILIIFAGIGWLLFAWTMSRIPPP